MALRIDKAVVRGEISNEERGLVTGKVWVAGHPEPLELWLEGNCLRDLAGCRLWFRNPRAEEDPSLSTLGTQQEGVTGDMTASRKVRRPAVSDHELLDLMERREEVPSRVANCLYLEWYSEANGRVVIESSEFELDVSSPAWLMTEGEERAELLTSQQRFQDYLENLTGPDHRAGETYDPDEDDESDEDDELGDDAEALDLGEESVDFPGSEADSVEAGAADDGTPAERLNEFEWEAELRDIDRRAEAYQEAFEKYRDHPQRERLIAEALGWDDGTEAAGELEAGLDDSAEWNEDEDPTEPHHPLSQQAMDFALTLQREAEERGLMADNSELRDSPVLALILHIISLGGKLAAALDGWAQGHDPEPGFIIAMLKRAQVPLNEALHAFDCIETSGLSEDTKAWLSARKRDLFDLRREIIDLMQQLRSD